MRLLASRSDTRRHYLPVRAGLGTGLIQIDPHGGMPQRTSAAVAGNDALARESDGFPLDHLDGGEGLGLEAHVELFEARTLHGVLPWVLGLGPGCREVGRLLGRNVCGGVRLCHGSDGLGLRRGGRVGRGRCVRGADEEAVGGPSDGGSRDCAACGECRHGSVTRSDHDVRVPYQMRREEQIDGRVEVFVTWQLKGDSAHSMHALPI